MPFPADNNTLNKVAGTGADIVIVDILPEQPHADKLGTDEHEQHGKQHEHPFRRPLRAKANAATPAGRQSKPSRAITLPKTLSRRSGVVVKQVTRSYIRLIRRIKLYLDRQIPLRVHHRDSPPGAPGICQNQG
jgi:hypothetical protein